MLGKFRIRVDEILEAMIPNPESVNKAWSADPGTPALENVIFNYSGFYATDEHFIILDVRTD